jgi:hypothetical protein
MSFGISAAGWGAIGAIGSIGGSLLGASSSRKAASTQAAAAERAAELQDLQFQKSQEQQLYQYQQNRADILTQLAQQREDYTPYREIGTNALRELAAGTRPNGEFSQAYERTPFEADPGYQFRLNEGTKGIQRAAAARGGMYSGATLKALARFNSDLASQEYGNYDARQNTRENQFNLNRDFRRNNLASLAGIGQTATRDVNAAGSNATGMLASGGTNYANTLAQLASNNANNRAAGTTNAAEARASGYIGSSNAIGKGLANLYNNYQAGNWQPTNQYGNTPSISNSLADWSNNQYGYLDPGYDGP